MLLLATGTVDADSMDYRALLHMDTKLWQGMVSSPGTPNIVCLFLDHWSSLFVKVRLEVHYIAELCDYFKSGIADMRIL